MAFGPRGGGVRLAQNVSAGFLNSPQGRPWVPRLSADVREGVPPPFTNARRPPKRAPWVHFAPKGFLEVLNATATTLLWRVAVAAEHLCLIGLTGFEPATSPTRTERATKLRHSPNGPRVAPSCAALPRGRAPREVQNCPSVRASLPRRLLVGSAGYPTWGRRDRNKHLDREEWGACISSCPGRASRRGRHSAARSREHRRSPRPGHFHDAAIRPPTAQRRARHRRPPT